jgi:hypothetical protein
MEAADADAWALMFAPEHYRELGKHIAQGVELNEDDERYFAEQGIEASWLRRTWTGKHEPIWSDRVEFHQAGGFEFASDGKRAYLFLALTPSLEPLDLVAWRPKDGALQSWRNMATILGEENLESPRMHKLGGLPIHRSPLGWLKARRYGVVIVIRNKAARRIIDYGPFEAEDTEHANELRKLLVLRANVVVEDKL